MSTEMTSPDMAEAMRLTRDGRLAEATAVLRRLVRGKAQAASPSGTPHTDDNGFSYQPMLPFPGAQAGSSAGSKFAAHFPAPPPPWPNTVAWWTARPSEIPQPPMPQAVQGLLGRLDGLGVKSPAHMRAPVPPGARFVAATFTSEAGSRSYKVFIPSRCRGEKLPLVVMLHGCTQSPDDFAAGTRMNELAEERVFFVAYPAQPASANAQKCWNWFNPGHQQRDRGEPALIAGITRQVMRDHAVDPARVYVAGLSAGGAAAAIMGATYPDLYAAVGVHSGLACGAARDLPSAFAAMRQGGIAAPPRSTGQPVPTIVFHADQDTTVHPTNADQVRAQAAASVGATLQSRVEHGQVPGGRAYSRTLYADEADWPVLEQWTIYGGGHSWSGGSPSGSYTDPTGPDASREMLRFFLEHPHRRHCA